MAVSDRSDLEQQLAEHWAEQIDMGDLMQYFIDGQMSYIQDMGEDEFKDALIEAGLIDDEEEEEEDEEDEEDEENA